MKGQSPIAIGSGPVGAASTPELINWDLPGLNGLGFKSAPVTDTGVDRGTLAGVYGDTGIFFSTDPRTGYNSYGVLKPPLPGGPVPMKNNSGDTVGEYWAANITNSEQRQVQGVMTLWDSYQLRAYGDGNNTPLVDSNGRGNAPWGLGSAVAGPDSGYAWEFDLNAYDNTDGTATVKMQAAIKLGPWQRIRYPGSQIAQDQPGLVSSVLGTAGIDASLMGILPTAIPPDTTAIRFSFGQLELGRPEFSAVKVRILNTPSAGECWRMYGDSFGGDAGGTNGGKDHIWRYFDTTVMSLNPCNFLQKVVSKSLVAPGEIFYYDITFANNSSVSIPNVSITDTLPSGLVHVSAIPEPSFAAAPNFVWTLGTLAPGSMVTVRQYVQATGSGTLFNTATATSGSEVIGVANQSVQVSLRAILQKSKTVSPQAVAPGSLVDYTIEVENIGTGTNGTPLRVREFLPAGFTYDSLVSVILNGANIPLTPPSPLAVDASNPAQPLFTLSQGIQRDKKLLITFKALVGAAVEPGTYYNSFQLEYEGKVIPPIPEAPVIVAGGKIGDSIWRDWDGDGVRDPGEEGIAGVEVMLYAADGTTLLATTTTDANGNYYFLGLTAGTYVVKVNDGITPAGYTQTGDPDGTIDNAHTVILALDEQYLSADFGYQPTGSGVIGDKVYEDIGNDGAFNGADVGIPNVTVWLYEDTNGNGVIDAEDALVATTSSDGNGDYSFTGLATGYNYLVKVDTNDPDIQTYFNTAYPPGPTPYQLSGSDVLASPNLSGSDLDNDFGFWRVLPGSIGDKVYLDNDGSGDYNSGDTPLAGVTIVLYRDGLPVATTVSGPDGSYLFDNLGPGNYTVVVDATSAGVPSGYAPSASQYVVNLGAGQDFLTADFPFTPLLAKSVDTAFAGTGDTLNFDINVNYTGNSLLSDVIVRDFVPAGTTFSAAGQGGQLVNFTSAPGTPGQATFGGADISRIYAFQGGTTAFWRYNAAANTWNSSLATVPTATGSGSALTSDGTRYIYAFPGGVSSRLFYCYDAVTNVWSDTAVADLPGAADVQGVGASLVYFDDFIYAFPGNSTQFWRYSVAANSWTQMTAAPLAIGAGGGLATDGDNIYALRGAGTQTNWRYNVAANTWSAALDTVGQNVGAGSGFVYADDGFFYATTGAGQNRIYRYDAAANTWTLGTNGGSPNTGGDLAYDGTNLYMLLGNNTATFSIRNWDAADTARTAAPGVVNDGGGLTFLQSPAGILDSSIEVSPTVVAVGSPVTVTMTVQATQAVTNVVPSALTVSGAAATVSGPNVASQNLSANSPATFTWTVTPTSAGVLTFSASATGAGGANFESATSNSLLASPDGDSQFVQWNLGGNSPPVPASTSTGQFLFGLRGNNTTNFWAYGLPQTPPGSWNSTSPVFDPADTTGFNIRAGGRLARDGSLYLYAFQGGGTRVFLRYDTATNTWSDAAVADLPAQAAVVNSGGALVYLNGYVYAWPGGASNQFWRYNVATNTWETRANTLATVSAGAGLTTDGTFIYGTRGGGTQTFWRYNPATNLWEARRNIGRNVEEGGALQYAKGFIYLLTGKDKRTYRYNVAADTWARLGDLPSGNAKAGASLAYDGDDNLYAFRGDNKTNFNIFNLSSQAWLATSTLANAPANVGAGGALTFQPVGAITEGSVTASRSMVGNGSVVTVRLTITSPDNVGAVTAGTPTFTATGGATASFSGATLVTPDNVITGSNDPVIYEWTATVTASSSTIGSIRFNTPYTVTVGGASATPSTRTIIVTPTLTYSALVAADPPPVIRNTAQMSEALNAIPSTSSNVTETATTGSIGDRVWADLNGDGVQDADELGLSGVRVYVDLNNNGIWDPGEPYDITDAFGLYRIYGLSAGTYTVSTDASTWPDGYLPTSAQTLSVTVLANEQYLAADFGLKPAGTGEISSYIWLDADGDGVQDMDEVALPNIGVSLEMLVGGV